MAKLTGFINGMIITALILAIFSLFFAKLSVNYDVTYDNESMETLNKMNELNELTEDVRDQEAEMQEKSGVLDVIGSWFSSAYQALRISRTSIDIAEDMVDDGIGYINLGPTAIPIKTAIISILLISLIIGVFIAVLVKWDVL